MSLLGLNKTMRCTWLVVAVGCAKALNFDAFEPYDFDVTEALLDNGVDVSSVSALTQDSSASAANACDSAVRSATCPWRCVDLVRRLKHKQRT